LNFIGMIVKRGIVLINQLVLENSKHTRIW